MGWSGCTTPFDRLEDRFDPAAEEPMLSTVLDRELDEERSHDSPGPASDARSAAGRRATQSSGSALADSNGTRSIREECVLPVSISGPRRSISRTADESPQDWYAGDLVISMLACRGWSFGGWEPLVCMLSPRGRIRPAMPWP
jgi:hypothetical protein